MTINLAKLAEPPPAETQRLYITVRVWNEVLFDYSEWSGYAGLDCPGLRAGLERAFNRSPLYILTSVREM